MSIRWVAVDDNDSAINYSNGWTQENGANWNNQGNFGQPFMNTLHAVTGGSASFSYTFDGSDGKVIGTTNVKTSGSVQDPVWSCEVDGAAIPLSQPFAYVENNWVLCQWSNIAAGQHTLKVTATSSTQAFLFDQFQYVPSTNADITGVNVVIACTDTAINYDSGWQSLGGDLSRIAPAAGAVMSFSFYGTGITWFGYIPVELPHGSTTAAYSIDGGSSTTFTVPGSFGGNSQYSQLIFQTGTLPLGSHTLRVTSQGQTSLTPLVLTWLVVQNGVTQMPSSSSGNSGSGSTTTVPNVVTIVTFPGGGQSTATISGSRSATTSSNTGSGNGINSGSSSSNLPSSLAGTTSGNSGAGLTSASKSGPPIGAIVGGVLGGLVLVLAILLFLYYRRKKKERDANEAEQVQPFYRDIPSSGAEPSSFNGSLPVASGVHGPHQTTELGNSRGFFAGKAALASSSPQSPHTNTIPRSYSSPINSQADAYAESSARDSMHAASGPSSEVSVPSSAGSAAPLLRPNRKREEPIAESSQLETPRTVVTHEDSGFRMPRAGGSRTPLTSAIIEYPPAYTPG